MRLPAQRCRREPLTNVHDARLDVIGSTLGSLNGSITGVQMYSLRGVALPGIALGFFLAVVLLATLDLHGLEVEQILWTAIGAWFGTDLVCASIIVRDEPPA